VGLRREESVASQEFLFLTALQWRLDAVSLMRKFGEQRRYSLGRKKPAILPPVDGNRDNLSRVLPQLLLHHCQRLLGCHAGDSQEREARRQPFTPSRIRETGVGPRSPVQSQCGLALSSSMMRQSIQKGVGGGVVSLAGLAQKRTRRR